MATFVQTNDIQTSCLTGDELRQVGELEALEGRRWPRAWHSGWRWAEIHNVSRTGALQHKSTLSAADIVSKYDISRPFTGQLGTVSDSQRGALRLQKDLC